MCEGASINFLNIALQEKFKVPSSRFEIVKVWVKVLFGEGLRCGREAAEDLSAGNGVSC